MTSPLLLLLLSPPEKSVIVTKEEQEALVQVSQTLEEVVLRKIRNFRKCFPFGCPKDDLKVGGWRRGVSP